MQFPNTLLQTFLKSYSSLDSSGPLNNISRLCYTKLSFTPTPQHCIILTDIGSPTYPSSFCHSLGSQHIWGSLTLRIFISLWKYNTCMGYCSFHCLWKFYMCIFSSYCAWNHVITYMYINSYVSIKLWKSSRSGF